MDWQDRTIELMYGNTPLPKDVPVREFVIKTFHETRTKYKHAIEVLEDKGLHEMTEFEDIEMNYNRSSIALGVDGDLKQSFITAAEDFLRLKALDDML